MRQATMVSVMSGRKPPCCSKLPTGSTATRAARSCSSREVAVVISRSMPVACHSRRLGHTLGHPKEVAVRAGHSSVSFTLDRYGHLYPESDASLRDRLDTFFTAGQVVDEGVVIDLLPRTPRPQRGPAGS
jgi:hypothetical protein